MLRKIFGPKWGEVTGKCQRIHNEEIHNLHSSPNTIRVIKLRKIEMGRTCSTNGSGKRCVQGFGGETEAKDNIWKT